MERNKSDCNAEIKRLGNIVATNSDVENRLQHGIYELLQELDNLRDPRGINLFKLNLQKIIMMFPDYENLKNIQYKTLERSLRLMTKNL